MREGRLRCVIAQKAPLEGWVAVERDRKRKGKATHKLRETWAFFLPLDGRYARCHSSVLKREGTGEIKTGGEPLPKSKGKVKGYVGAS